MAFAEWVSTMQPDCFIIAGDVGHPERLFCRGLQLFERLTCPRLLVAGNHDVYRGQHDSRTLWEEVLPQITADEGFLWLEGAPVVIADGPSGLKIPAAVDPSQPVEDIAASRPPRDQSTGPPSGGLVKASAGPSAPVPASDRLGGQAKAEPWARDGLGICGTLGWYDYSSGAPHLNYDEEDYRQLKPLVNHDADYVDWPWSDVAVARYLGRGFARALEELEADPTVTTVLAVTHVPPFSEALAPTLPLSGHPDSHFWSLLRAYLGNFSLGSLLRQQPKVRYVVSGHIHRPGRWPVSGDYGLIDFQVVGSQEGQPRAVVLDI